MGCLRPLRPPPVGPVLRTRVGCAEAAPAVQVTLLRSALGEAATPIPAIDIGSAFSSAANAAFGMTLNPPFSPCEALLAPPVPALACLPGLPEHAHAAGRALC